MKNSNLIIAYLLAAFILPLAPLLDCLFHYKTGILMLACIVMLAWANPVISMEEGKNHVNSDRNTMLWIFVMGYIAIVTPVIEWGYFRPIRRWTTWTTVGIILIVIGLWFRIYAIRVLGAHFTGVVQKINTHQLITVGPYRRVRHPSYLGSLMAISGCAVLLEAWIGLIIGIISMLVAYVKRITVEERLLFSVFGETYKAYQMHTWRLIPGIW